MASVCMERMIAISSAILAVCGNNSEISAPDLPCFWNLNSRAHASQLLAGELGDALAFGVAFRHGLAVQFDQLWLVIEQIELRRRAGLKEVNNSFSAWRFQNYCRTRPKSLMKSPSSAPCTPRPSITTPASR